MKRSFLISFICFWVFNSPAFAQWEYSYYHYPPHRLDDCEALDSTTFWACGAYGYIIKSTDSGRTWDQETRGPLGSGIDFYEIDFYGHQYGWAATGPGGGCSIVSTADYGETWQVVYEGLALTWPSGLEFSDSLNGILAGRETIYRTTDGGHTWILPDSLPAGFDCLGISGVGGGEFWACGRTLDGPQPTILHSTDGGIHWSLNSNLGDTLQAAVTAIEFADPGHGWVSVNTAETDSRYIFGTSDTGTTWILLSEINDGGQINIYDNLVAHDTLNLRIGGVTGFAVGKIKRSIDGGRTWYDEFSGNVGLVEGFDMYDSTHGLVVGGPIRDNSPLILYYDNTTDVAEADSPPIPMEFSLSAYPNPFNSATTITLTGAAQADIGIYDISGRLITTLHTVGGQAVWDASGCSSGLYFARVNGNNTATVKLILVK